MVARVFVALVGATYALLSIWCAVAPKHTSGVVGYELKPGAGESEFLSVYGGLEMGLALVFLLPLLRPETTEFALLAVLLIHAAICVFRTVGWFLYAGMPSTTYLLAGVEWAITIAAAVLYWPIMNASR